MIELIASLLKSERRKQIVEIDSQPYKNYRERDTYILEVYNKEKLID